jgi:hypothetical protein
MELLDAVLGTDESLKVWEDVLAIVGWSAGQRGVIIDGRLVDKGPVVPDQLPRARRLAALRTRTLLRAEFGDTDTARSVLSRLVELLDQLDADEEPEAGKATTVPPRRRARKKAAE